MKGKHEFVVTDRLSYRVTMIAECGVSLYNGDELVHRFVEGKTTSVLDLGAGPYVFKPSDAKAEYAYEAHEYVRQEEEPRDDVPPPEPPRASNFMKALRNAVRSEMAGMRETFLTRDTDYPGYELDEDDPGLFEEEEKRAQDALKKLSEKETAGSGNESDNDSAAPSTVANSEPPSDAPSGDSPSGDQK